MPPKFFIDECLSPDLARYLNEQGFDAVAARNVGRLGESDHSVRERCFREDRIIVTHNGDDFRHLVGAVELHPGLIILTDNTITGSFAQVTAVLDRLEREMEPRDWMVNRVIEVGEGSVLVDYELPGGV